MEWNETALPGLGNIRSTERDQPLPRHLWPSWAPAKFTGVWLTLLSDIRCLSTGMLSTGDAWAHLDVERRDQRSPSYRYYRHVLSRTIDGRVFQFGPFTKNLGYEHHLAARPSWLHAHPTWSTSSSG